MLENATALPFPSLTPRRRSERHADPLPALFLPPTTSWESRRSPKLGVDVRHSRERSLYLNEQRMSIPDKIVW